jgi:drug/metabolite transporter (DMT)-like permease
VKQESRRNLQERRRKGVIWFSGGLVRRWHNLSGVPPFTLLIWILTCAIWSTVWLFIKLGVRDVPPSAFAVFRMAIAFVVLTAIILLRRVPLPRRRRERALIAWTGVVLLGLNYGLLNWGIQFISSGLTAVLQAMTPVFGFVFAHLLLRDEKVTPWKALALGLGVTGVGVIFWDQLDVGGARAVQGSVAVIASAACVAIAYVAMKRRGAGLDPSVITAGQLLAALIPLSIYSAVVEHPFEIRWTRTALVSGLYLALLGSVAGAWLNYWLLKRIGATKLLSMGLIEPLVAVLLGAAFLGEDVSIRTIVGGALILAGVAIVLDIFR